MIRVDPYLDVKTIRQKHLHAMNHCKVTAIKDEIEKFLKDGFIYLLPLTEWVSNTVHVDKKQWSIRVCTDFRDLNRACPKDNFPILVIQHILDEYAGSEVFLFMDAFLGYN